MEAKKQGAGEEDLSMEEILQSIRRIIADDGGETKPASAATPVLTEDSPVASSDILELTEMIEDDGTITNVKSAKKDAVDVLDNIDAALKPAPAAEAPKPEAPKETPAPAPAKNSDDDMSDEEMEALLSKTAEQAAISSLAKLNIPEPKIEKQLTPSPQFRSGMTVEDMVEELLKPMMKEWLDNNLPIIVEKIVEREVVRLTRR